MPKQKNGRVTISSNTQRTLLADIYERRCIEACGLLTGSIDDLNNWYIEQAHPLRNIFDSPVYFEFAPEDILAVELEYPGQVVGAYHSHPTGLTVASSTDRQNMMRVNVEQQIPWVWLIISGPFDKVCTSLRPVRRRHSLPPRQETLSGGEVTSPSDRMLRRHTVPQTASYTLSPPLRGHPTDPSIIAYYHYEHKGLRQIPIQFEEVTAAIAPNMQEEQSNKTFGHEEIRG